MRTDLAIPSEGVELVAGGRGAPGVVHSLQVAPGHEQEVLARVCTVLVPGNMRSEGGIAHEADAELIPGVPLPGRVSMNSRSLVSSQVRTLTTWSPDNWFQFHYQRTIRPECTAVVGRKSGTSPPATSHRSIASSGLTRGASIN